ncbi:unnamed protein product, partial [marine sediment metagenome]
LRKESNESNQPVKNILAKKDDDTLIIIGRPYAGGAGNWVPSNRWLRLVFPLPSDATFEVRLILDYYSFTKYGGATLRIDDFRIISKD